MSVSEITIVNNTVPIQTTPIIFPLTFTPTGGTAGSYVPASVTVPAEYYLFNGFAHVWIPPVQFTNIGTPAAAANMSTAGGSLPAAILPTIDDYSQYIFMQVPGIAQGIMGLSNGAADIVVNPIAAAWAVGADVGFLQGVSLIYKTA